MTGSDLIYLLAVIIVLLAIVGAACFYAGWRSSAAYLPAARAVAEVSSAAVQQANEHAAFLDKNEAALSSLVSALTKNTETLEARFRAVEDALIALFQGMERAGFIKSGSARAVARQVGESNPDPEG